MSILTAVERRKREALTVLGNEIVDPAAIKLEELEARIAALEKRADHEDTLAMEQSEWR